MLRRRPTILTVAIAVLIALVSGCGHAAPITKVVKPAKHAPKPRPKPVHHYFSPTTGLAVPTTGGQFFAATIENSPQARPQTGLLNADIVYEMEAEGTITRYLALFHDDIPASVGPMRSARPYFITTAEDWGAPFIHFGGSPEAYQMLKSYPYPQIDGITQGSFFARDSSRQAPHNAYLQTATLSPFHTSVRNDHFRFGRPPIADAKAIQTISIDYNSFTQVQYVYNAKDKTYLRYQDGKPDDDRSTNQQLYATNVIIQYAQMNLISNDSKGRITINLNGPGLALYFTDGKEIAGTWKRDQSGQLVYYDAQGHMMTVSPGKTWIEVVNDSVQVAAQPTATTP